MQISRTTKQTRISTRKRRSKTVLVALCATSLMLTIGWGNPARGQIPEIPGLNQVLELIQRDRSDAIAIRSVTLDGRELFQIASRQNSNPGPQETPSLPIDVRVEAIEKRLNRLARANFDSQQLQVTYQIKNRQPVIYINWPGKKRPLEFMTVTTLDAQIHGDDPIPRAEALTSIIQQALIQARQERQPAYLQRQALMAGGITLGMILASWLMSRWQRSLQARWEAIAQQTPDEPSISSAEGERTGSNAMATVLQRLTKLQQGNLNDIQRRLLQTAQVVILQSGSFVIVGLFPYTRILQPIIIASYKVLVVGVGTYLAVRISAILIDRFFSALKDGAFLDPVESERSALRVATFSRVLKNIAGLSAITIGGLLGLSVLGINLVPLLAGAGIFGLAISFASQSLIKDMINGFLILLEDQYAVGDVIAVGNVAGFVENMNLRITQLRNAEGRLITIPNGTISVVENLSKNWSRVDVAVDVAYETDVDQAIATIKNVAEKMYREKPWNERIIEAPEVLGIDELDHAGILIRTWIKTQPLQQWSVAREFRRRLKVAFDQEGIGVGVPEQSLWFRTSLQLQGDRHNRKDGSKLRQIEEHSDHFN